MICLTGDIHHQSLATGNQSYCPISEVRVARLFLDLLDEFELDVTFFITGRAFDEEWGPDLRYIAEHPRVEIGGHTYDCFEPRWLHRITNKLFGSYNGTSGMERRDVRRTIEAIRRRTDKRIRLWRNHMYMHGPHTDRILADEGIELVSDGVGSRASGPEHVARGLWSFPINVIPDHEHLLHAERTPEWVEGWVRRYGWSDDYGSESFEMDEWVRLVLGQVDANEKRGATSNLLIHPITMYVADGFAGARRIVRALAMRETGFLSATLSETREAVA